MTRRLALVLLAGLVLPAVPASACSPAHPAIDVSRDRVAAGAEVRVSGDMITRRDGSVPGCTTPVPPPLPSPSPTGADSASPQPEPSETPLVSLPPLVPVSYRTKPAPSVAITLSPWYEWFAEETQPRTLDVIAAPEPVAWQDGLYRWRFTAAVRIPADVAPGRYVLNAAPTTGSHGPYYGRADVVVVSSLAATGGHTADLVRLALLSLVTGAGVLALGRRAAGSSPRRGSTASP